ncbi:MAG: tryptophan--tRNA ligase [Spirochaetes bacterium GWF1_41_5]|nr:MAG: tryptophan--tRNA ligase [Spirochaetes bacterium GWF1_41_5]HBE04517.1 tryptophan--tRNA ligase [Spirochaetia bacterium]
MKRILTGDRPTGNLHLGHYIGTLKNRARLQHEYETYLLVADVQCLTTNFDRPEQIKEDIYNVIAGYFAAGIDPQTANIVIQSRIPEIAELTLYYSMIVPMALLKYNPTIKSEIAAGYAKEMTYGFFGYPVNQAADITIFGADLVPVGKDQVPHIELTRKIVRKFNALYGEVLTEPRELLGEVPVLPGLDGREKMSKSLGNAIFLCDDDESIVKKIKSAVTDKSRIHPSDPGHPEVCTVFMYYRAFFPDQVPGIETGCSNAAFGCVACKKRFAENLCAFIKPMRERYFSVRNDHKFLEAAAQRGTARGRELSAATMQAVKRAMKIDYFI